MAVSEALRDLTEVEVPGTGTIQSMRLRRTRSATSSLVTVCGFNLAGSFQAVSLPGAAPESTKPGRISRKASGEAG